MEVHYLMRKLLSFLLISLLLFSCIVQSFAEEFDQMSVDELLSARNDLINELYSINVELGNRYRTKSPSEDGKSLGKIKELFPDEALAMVVRDSCAKFSIEQTVTQSDLDKIKSIQLFSREHGDFTDLTGIGYLRNLQTFSLYNSMEYLGTILPEEFYTLTNLTTIELAGSKLATLSESLGNLVNLKKLDISRTDVAKLPNSIGNLVNLKYLDIGYTKITELPDSIWTLSLDSLNMAALPIK